MKDFAKPAFLIALVFAVAVVLVNDVGAALFGYLRIENATQKIAEESSRVYNASGGDERAAGIAAVEAGKRDGIEVYGWQLKENKITVWTRTRPRKTLLLGRIVKDFETRTAATFKYTEPVK